MRLDLLPMVFPPWLLHGMWTEGRESGVEEPSAFKVRGERQGQVREEKVCTCEAEEAGKWAIPRILQRDGQD